VLRNVGTAQFSTTDAKLNDFNQVATTKDVSIEIDNLEGNCVYYFMVTAVNSEGEGYKTKTPSFVRTQPDSI
jgi:hypothetical protein